MREWDARRVARAAGARLVFEPEPGPSWSPARSGAPDAPPDAAPGGAGSPGPRRVTIDSRRVAPGDLFVGLRGTRRDGGEFAAQALQAGAWGVLVAPEHALAVAAMAQARMAEAATGEVTSGEAGPGTATGTGMGQVGVVLADPDPLAGLQALAGAWLGELRGAGARVVAITGSTGKTSTKDILAALLAARLRTAASPENLNTEIGVPLAILGAPAGSEALVLELAMRGGGQIAQLTALVQPEVGVVVNVGPVHLELLGSLEAIAAAKAELIAGLAPGATAIVPAGEPLLEEHLREDLQTIRFGPGGDVQLAGREEREGRVWIADTRAAPEPARIALRPSFAQEHNLANLLAAVAAARALGVTPGGEVTVRFSALRGERVELAEGIVLIDDCYNANPMSMRSALEDLARTAAGRRVAVLGDMLELGPGARGFHREIGALAGARGVELLVTVGPLAAEMGATFQGGTLHRVPDARAAARLLPGLLAPGDTVLVKGSRGVGLELVGQALRAREPARSAEGAPGRGAGG